MNEVYYCNHDNPRLLIHTRNENFQKSYTHLCFTETLDK
jgi:hypothetical protein